MLENESSVLNLMLGTAVLISEIQCKSSNVPLLRSPVMHEERISPVGRSPSLTFSSVF